MKQFFPRQIGWVRVVFLAFFLAACSEEAADSHYDSVGELSTSQIDEIFADYLSGDRPGCSVGVYQQGEMVFSRGYGLANMEYGIPIEPQTAFRIASMSKQFAAMAIALLAEEGKLSLDDDIRTFFPDMHDFGEPITVSQLIYHTSGLRDYLDLAWIKEWGDAYSEDETIALIQRQTTLNYPPGTEYLYSNTGYVLIARIVEIVTGQTLREWSQANMFEPLGMRNSHFHDDHTHIVNNRAYGYRETDDGEFKVSMTTLDNVGDGALITTVEDLLLWDRNFYDNALGKGDPALIELVETPGTFDNGEPGDYAFGLTVEDFHGTPEIWHDGGWYGVSTSMHRYPDHQLTVAVLCNDEEIWASDLARDVAMLIMGFEGPEMPAEEGAGEPSEAEQDTAGQTVGMTQLEQVAGTYYSVELEHSLRFVIREDSLQAIRRPENITLVAKGPDTFEFDWMTATFERGPDGQVRGVVLSSERARNIRFLRQSGSR